MSKNTNLILDILKDLDLQLKKEITSFENKVHAFLDSPATDLIMLNNIPLKVLDLALEYDEVFLKISNNLIGTYLNKLTNFKNNIELAGYEYEILLKVFIHGYDIVRNNIMKKNMLQEFGNKHNPYPNNLLPEVEEQLLQSFEKLYVKTVEPPYTFDAFNSIPLKHKLTESHNNLIKETIKKIHSVHISDIKKDKLEYELESLVNNINHNKEVYDFTGHSTKDIDIENSQGTLFFEFTPSSINRKLYILQSLSKANSPPGFVDYANLIIFYFYIVKCVKGLSINNNMNNRHYFYIMNTELLFIGDRLGYNNEHNKWLFKTFYKKNYQQISTRYYDYFIDENTNLNIEELKKESINQIGKTIENVLHYIKSFNFDSLKLEYQQVFKYCYEIYCVLKEDYTFKQTSIDSLIYISKKLNIGEIKVSSTIENHFLKYEEVIKAINSKIEATVKLNHTHSASNKLFFNEMIEAVNLHLKSKKKCLIKLEYYTDFSLFLNKAQELSKNLIDDSNLDSILKFITFDNFALCNKLSDKLYCEAMSLFFLVLNNIHFSEVKENFIPYLSMITKYQPLQDFYIELLESKDIKRNDLFKITYSIEFLYPIMKGRHQYKMELIDILSNYFFTNLPILELESHDLIVVSELKTEKIDILLKCYTNYQDINSQSSIYLQDILASGQNDIKDLVLLYNSCKEQKINDDLQKTIENFLGNSLRNNVFDNTSPFFDRSLIQK